MMRRWLAFFVLVTSIATQAQETPGQAGQASPPVQEPTFRTGVDVITLDVSAVDGAGRPVTDLRAPDFVVRIDGQPRRVVSVEAVQFDAAAIRRDLAAQPFESSFSTNQAAPSARLIVLAVDQLNIQPGSVRQLLQSASRFLDSLSPLDRVAFFAYPAPGVSVDFTTDRARIRKAMDTVVGAAQRFENKFNIGLFEAIQAVLRNNEVIQDRVIARECRRLQGQALDECMRQVLTEMALMVNRVREDRKQSLAGLEQILEGLALVDAPKSLIMMSEGLVLDDPSEVDGIVRASSRARASVNVLMMDVLRGSDVGRGAVMPPTMTEDRDLQTNGLRELAAASRGSLYNVFGNGATIFDRLASELSAYYVIGVEEEAGDRNDRTHRIDIEVRRQGVQLRSRRAFILAPPRQAPAPAEQLVDLLKAPFGVSGVPLRVTTFAVQDSASTKVRLLVAADVDQAGSPARDFTIGWLLLDADGRVAASAGERRTLQPSSAGQSGALEYRAETLVEPGVYSLRLGVVDQAGRRGALVRDVNAWKMAGEDFAVADLVVGPPPRSGQVVLASVEPQVAATVAAVVELYSSNPATFASTEVIFEVAEHADAPALLTSRADIVDGDRPNARAAQAIIAAQALRPGRYVVRARIARAGTPAGLLTRPFVLTASAASAPTVVLAAAIPTLPPVPAFDRSATLAADVIAELLSAIERRSPALKTAVTEARAGRYSAGSLEALGSGDQAVAAFLKGLDFYVTGQLGPAATQLNVAAGPRREFFPAAFFLGATFAATGRDRDAASAWQLGFGAETRLPLAYALFAEARLRDGQPQSVVDVLEPVWREAAGDARLGRSLARALILTGRSADALPILEGVIASHPTDAEALLFAITAQFEANGRGQRPLSPEDRARLQAWSRAYDGPQRALIDRYIASQP